MTTLVQVNHMATGLISTYRDIRFGGYCVNGLKLPIADAEMLPFQIGLLVVKSPLPPERPGVQQPHGQQRSLW